MTHALERVVAGADALPQVGLQYLTVEEVAAMLRITPKALYRFLAHEPTLPVLRLGRGPRARLRFPRQRLEVWLRQRER